MGASAAGAAPRASKPWPTAQPTSPPWGPASGGEPLIRCSTCQASGVGSALPPVSPLAAPLVAGGAEPARSPPCWRAEGEARSHACSDRSVLGVRAAGSSSPGVAATASASTSASPFTNRRVPSGPAAGAAGVAASGFAYEWKPAGACSSSRGPGATGVASAATRSVCGLALLPNSGGRGMRLPPVDGGACCCCCWGAGPAGMRLGGGPTAATTVPSTFLLFFLSDCGPSREPATGRRCCHARSLVLLPTASAAPPPPRLLVRRGLGGPRCPPRSRVMGPAASKQRAGEGGPAVWPCLRPAPAAGQTKGAAALHGLLWHSPRTWETIQAGGREGGLAWALLLLRGRPVSKLAAAPRLITVQCCGLGAAGRQMSKMGSHSCMQSSFAPCPSCSRFALCLPIRVRTANPSSSPLQPLVPSLCNTSQRCCSAAL